MAAVACVVAIVPPVSGFAQSNDGYRPAVALGRTATGVLREYVAHAADAPGPAGVPANLRVGRLYRSLLENMLRSSPTFRRQCRRIANSPQLEVTLAVGGTSWPHGVRARTQMVRTGDRLSATIELPLMDDPVELIAHEIEHIVEQLDGVDLRAKAGLTFSGVRLCASDAMVFETDRATRVGLTVSSEVRGGG